MCQDSLSFEEHFYQKWIQHQFRDRTHVLAITNLVNAVVNAVVNAIVNAIVNALEKFSVLMMVIKLLRSVGKIK